MRRCFLDLDGVLVDFIGAACKLHGFDNPFDHQKNWGSYRIENLLEIPKPDFYGKMGEEFWSSLKFLPDALNILNLVLKTFGEENICILTSPIRTKGCCEGKIQWLKKNLPYFWEKKQFFVGSSKQFCANENAWLIDDSDENIDKFSGWGGNTIQVPRPWNRLHHLSGSVLACLNVYLPEKEYKGIYSASV